MCAVGEGEQGNASPPLSPRSPRSQCSRNRRFASASPRCSGQRVRGSENYSPCLLQSPSSPFRSTLLHQRIPCPLVSSLLTSTLDPEPSPPSSLSESRRHRGLSAPHSRATDSIFLIGSKGAIIKLREPCERAPSFFSSPLPSAHLVLIFLRSATSRPTLTFPRLCPLFHQQPTHPLSSKQSRFLPRSFTQPSLERGDPRLFISPTLPLLRCHLYPPSPRSPSAQGEVLNP